MLLDLIHKIPNQMEEILGPEGRINFWLFRKAQNAFQVLASSPRYVVNFISAEEGTRPFTVSRRARLSSGASRTCLSTSCTSVAFLAF
ncbi:hypothetical protein E4412_00580 [Leptospira interrogans]|nr:hypothetical protein [Leptospira interrogans]QCO35895.1 hypothetical protein E4412_00580 [Leptospira interrogans]